MLAEVISIGDELTSGQRLDTNSQWLSERLGEIGVKALFHTTVADDLAANTLVFRQAAERADVAIASGGLGPTADDLTRDALAAAAGVQLVLDEEQLAYIKSLFARRLRRDMPERNVVQAMFPAGSRPIHNPHGTAPGIAMDLPRSSGGVCRVFCLPGVPAEMKEMWPRVEEELRRQGAGRSVIRHRRIKCFGVGESDLEAMLPDIIRRGREPSVGITVSAATITLRITAAGATHDDCLAAMESTVQTIHGCLGPLVYGEEDDELEHAVVRLLQSRSQTLSVVELGSGGLISAWMREADPAGEFFRGGAVLSGREGAAILDGELTRIVAAAKDVKDRVARLAQACREKFATDFALAVGPFPIVDHRADVPGRVAFAVASPQHVQSDSAAFAGHPEILKLRASKQGLDRVRMTLLNHS